MSKVVKKTGTRKVRDEFCMYIPTNLYGEKKKNFLSMRRGWGGGENIIEEAKILPVEVIVSGMLLGFPLSLLFFMDQNIAESMVNSPDNKLIKGE
jgi:hypothetical protein